MAKILFVTTRYPYPPDDGGKFDTFMVLKALSKHFDIYLLYIGGYEETLNKLLKEAGLKSVYNFKKDTKNSTIGLFLNIFSSKPYTIRKYHSHKLYKYIENIVRKEKIEIVFIDHLHMAYYGLLLKKYLNIPIVLREHNVESEFWKELYNEEKSFIKKLIYKWQTQKTLRYEKKVVKEFDLCLMISAIDEKKIKEVAPDVITVAISTPIDLGFYFSTQKAVPHSIAFVGNFSWPPNIQGIVWFLDKVWPEIKSIYKDSKLFIIGKNPPEELKRIRTKGVVVTGYVKDIRPWISMSEVFVVPIFWGGGIKIKILEAMAMGKIVVTTEIGARGVGAEDGKDMVIANTREEFFNKISNLFKNQNLSRNISTNARAFIKKNFSLGRISAQLKEVIHGL